MRTGLPTTDPSNEQTDRLDQHSNVSGGFDRDFIGQLAAVEERSFWYRARNELIVQLVSKWVEPGARFLEVGCGPGFVLTALARECHLRVTGGDLFVEALDYAEQRVPEAELVQLDAMAVPYSEAFDAVGAFDVLEHVEDDLAALRGLQRAVCVGGHVFITVPQHPWLWSSCDEHDRHVRRYVRSELVDRLKQAGLTPLRVTSFVTFLLPLMAISRRRHRAGRASYNPVAELVLPAPVDRLLERVLRLESRLISRGLNFPVGGSLVIVARRDRA